MSERASTVSPPGRVAALLCLACGLALVGTVMGCAPDPIEPPFEGSATSLRSLGEGVLRGLSVGDTALLERFRLTEREHNEVVWPELPASSAEADFPVEWAWMNIELRNRRALTRLSFLEGRELDLAAVQCRGETQVFRTFRVRTDCWVRFDAEGLGPVEARLFKDVLERNGGFKTFRYYEEPFRRLAAASPRAAPSVSDGPPVGRGGGL